MRRLSRHNHYRVTVPAAVLAVAVGLTACGGSSTGAKAPNRTGNVGYDVSYPQCGQILPDHPAFAIVGVNGTLANNFNPCLRSETKWAKGSSGNTSVPKVSFYVHIADPGNQVADWPKSGSTPDGKCDGGNTKACAYKYGETLAQADVARLGELGVRGARIYLDAEKGFSYGPSARNDAVMLGMLSVITSAGYEAGVYTQYSEWRQIAGDAPPHTLENLPVWVLGATTPKEALHNCDQTGFTGTIIVAQSSGDPSNTIDRDYACA